MTAGVVVAILISGFFTGAMARLAVPGPDPMPLWLTLAIGLAGSVAGAVIAKALGGGGYAVSFASLGVAIGLVLAYRRFIQRRPLWGPEALKFPERGLGVEHYRERLQKLGVDPDAVSDPARLQSKRLESMLEELHRAGLLDDDELAEKKRALVERR
ncbi:MAG TPA: hypothetical protein VFL66_11790 [Gaiellaceae bacterium]|nr:hypothetical protein [Gaiellaceae bacterium]